MTLHQLRVFECVAKDLNITRASAQLHLTQPTVSQQIKFLEGECGVKFLSRTSRGVELTLKGRAFLNAIAPILRQLETVEAEFQPNRKARQAEILLVGGSSSISVSSLPQALIALRKTHPGFRFVLETNNSHDLERRVSESQLDIAIITNSSNCPTLVYEPFQRHKVIAFAAPNFPLVGRIVKLTELSEIPLVFRTGSSTLHELTKLGVRLNLAVHCDAMDAVKASVYKGMGVGILHRESVENDIAAGMLKQIRVPELEKLQVRSYIVYDGHKPLRPIAQAFLELLRQNGKVNTPTLNKTPVNMRASRKFGEQILTVQKSVLVESVFRRPPLMPKA